MSQHGRQYFSFLVQVVSIPLLILPAIHVSYADNKSSNIDVVAVKYQDVEQERLLDGLVEAVHKATVSAQTSGRVKQIYFDVNDYAKKGDVLLRMRDADQQAGLKVAQANFNQAKSEAKRVNDLFAKKLISKSVVDKTEAALKSATAQLEQAQENLERTVVRAPYSGIMTKRHIEVGETARSGSALFTGLSLESLRVAVNLPQDIIRQAMQYKAARLVLPKQDKIIDSTSVTISPYADEVSHTFLARVNLPDIDLNLYPGMSVKVAFTTGKARKLVIPISVIAYRSEVTAVYVMNNKELSMRHIRLGNKVNGNMVEVLSGLEENEKIATDPVKSVSYLKEQQIN